MHVALQIAYFMGFQTVLITGMDHRYHLDNKLNELRVLSGPGPNHFSPTDSENSHWNNPDLESVEEAFRLARFHHEADGRRMIDCTSEVAREVFTKRAREEAMQ